ncbi:hypothetical protein GALMADRAFT_214553 [Galerina marginata CBS 339.88]|uniref:Uncharacterized protein n=1 Tax=Galerina marginata (strain CBS 339.88) TaxID=685588 RepID=A0A067SHT4_GALM3|nr:hypothetical protein GALMADRAFT_214553 [Galerina marginata CBS 339.88]
MDAMIKTESRSSRKIGPREKGRRIVVGLPVNDKVTRDIEFPVDIPYLDFCDRIMAALGVDPASAVLGWKTSNKGKRAAAHELGKDLDMEHAFNTILNIQDNRYFGGETPSRYRR